MEVDVRVMTLALVAASGACSRALITLPLFKTRRRQRWCFHNTRIHGTLHNALCVNPHSHTRKDGAVPPSLPSLSLGSRFAFPVQHATASIISSFLTLPQPRENTRTRVTLRVPSSLVHSNLPEGAIKVDVYHVAAE